MRGAATCQPVRCRGWWTAKSSQRNSWVSSLRVARARAARPHAAAPESSLGVESLEGACWAGTHHEKQIGALCAVHCLNNLLQGPHFDVSPRTASLRLLPATPPGLRDYTSVPDPAPRGTESRLREPLRPRHTVTALSRADRRCSSRRWGRRWTGRRRWRSAAARSAANRATCAPTASSPCRRAPPPIYTRAPPRAASAAGLRRAALAGRRAGDPGGAAAPRVGVHPDRLRGSRRRAAAARPRGRLHSEPLRALVRAPPHRHTLVRPHCLSAPAPHLSPSLSQTARVPLLFPCCCPRLLREGPPRRAAPRPRGRCRQWLQCPRRSRRAVAGRSGVACLQGLTRAGRAQVRLQLDVGAPARGVGRRASRAPRSGASPPSLRQGAQQRAELAAAGRVQSKEAGYSVFVVRGAFGRHPLESDARGLAALLAATKGYTSAGVAHPPPPSLPPY